MTWSSALMYLRAMKVCQRTQVWSRLRLDPVIKDLDVAWAEPRSRFTVHITSRAWLRPHSAGSLDYTCYEDWYCKSDSFCWMITCEADWITKGMQLSYLSGRLTEFSSLGYNCYKCLIVSYNNQKSFKCYYWFVSTELRLIQDEWPSCN